MINNSEYEVEETLSLQQQIDGDETWGKLTEEDLRYMELEELLFREKQIFSTGELAQ